MVVLRFRRWAPRGKSGRLCPDIEIPPKGPPAWHVFPLGNTNRGVSGNFVPLFILRPQLPSELLPSTWTPPSLCTMTADRKDRKRQREEQEEWVCEQRTRGTLFPCAARRRPGTGILTESQWMAICSAVDELRPFELSYNRKYEFHGLSQPRAIYLKDGQYSFGFMHCLFPSQRFV
jgi:hypothetical protein